MKMPKPAFRPLGDIVLVTLEEADENVGKEVEIIAPQSAQEKPYHGTVLRCGDSVKQLMVGDRILFTKYSGKPIEIDGQKYQYMKEAEVVGVFELE